MVVLVDYRVPLAPSDEPAIQRESDRPGNQQGGDEAPPEQKRAETRVHRTIPSTSPMAHPVKQWTVALSAVRLRDGV